MPRPEDPRTEPPISDYDFWMVGKRERLGTQLSGYARVMFLPEAKHMKETGESYSEEWFEVWDGILPPIVYRLIESNEGKNQHYQHVLFISAEDAKKAGITVFDHHPQYSRMFPGVFLDNIKYKGVSPGAVVEITDRVRARLQTLPPKEERTMKVAIWQYAGIARERVV